MAQVREILLFAQAADLAGTRRLESFFLASQTVADVRCWLVDRFPHLAGMIDSCAWAMDEEIVSLDHPLHSARQVALLPPVSGG